jgi:hypothetical protein
MATYRNIQCNNCRNSLTDGFRRNGTLDNFTDLGPEYLVCSKCGTKNRTGFTPFNKMNLFRKGEVLLFLLGTTALYGGIIGFLLLKFITFLLKKNSIVNNEFVLESIHYTIASAIVVVLLSFLQIKGLFKNNV